VIELFSDTQTRPTPAMREAMARAEVGDEQLGLDPTVEELCARVASLLGHEAGVLLPSGTMGNLIGLLLHVGTTGEEVLLHELAHPRRFEAGGAARLVGAVLTPLASPTGVFDAAQVRAAAHDPGDRYAPRTRLVSVEQPTNVTGGHVWPLETLDGVLAAAADLGLATHLDGARLLNAVVASGVPADRWAGGVDTAWIDFTKGLGAPLGAVLVGSADTIARAWRFKQMLGGALRQAGVAAAACLHALDHHVDRLADDHARARRLAEAAAEVAPQAVDPTAVETNIVVLRGIDAPAVREALARRGVGAGALGPSALRLVTHLDVDDADCAHAATALQEALRETEASRAQG